MNKRILSLGLILFAGFGSFAQQGDGGNPKGAKILQTIKNLDSRQFAEPDIEALRAEDALVEADKSGPWRFGYNNYTNLNFDNSGTWTELSNGGKIWQLDLRCENALTVNLTFENLTIAEGNELYVYNPEKSFILGKFTDRHLYEGQLGTELVPGDEVIVEYYVSPENADANNSLTIATVTHGYRTADEYIEKAFGNSGSCNMNVACPDGIPYENQIRATVMLVSNSNGFCTGSMINNCNSDGTPYVLTANHCYSNPATWIFRFNWQSATCTNPGSEPSFESLSGAVLRARRTPSDFCLVEITGGLEGGTVPIAYNTYFPGWDYSDNAPSSAVCVHHPSGDIKKISFDDNPLTSGNGMGSTEANSQWVLQWDRSTTTEPGSSGSPLFDQNGRIVGQLWGGGASCSALTSPDYYGKVSYSWNPAGSNSTNHLVSWLDPCGTGVETLDGYDPNGPAAADDAGVLTVTSPTGNYCTNQFTPELTLKNFGSNTLTSVDILYNLDGGGNTTYPWTGSLAPGAVETITLPVWTAGGGAHTFNATTQNPNGTTDGNSGNDGASSSFNLTVNGEDIELTIMTDCWGSEVSWEVQDAGGNTLITGGGYSDVTGGETILEEFCLAADQCYNFIINDAYGDGMYGSQYGSCGIDGDYSIVQVATGIEVAGLQAANANYGTQEISNFCVVVGLDELVGVQFSVYPNPSNGIFNINLQNEGDAEIIVRDITGRTVYAGTALTATHELNLSNVSNGTYMLQVAQNGAITTKSIVIRK